jgi:CRISPR-associated protein Csm2
MSNFQINPEWIKKQATQEMVSFAEQAGKYMADKQLTKSKIRSIYGEIKRIQMGTFEQEKSSFYLLKPKVAYALGRDANNEGLKTFKSIFDQCYPLVVDEKTYKNFSQLIESILAYHRAFGGKD